MRVEHDIDATRAALQRVASGLDEAMEGVLRRGSTRVGAAATSTYMRDAKGEGRRRPEDSGPLRILSGRLARAVGGTRGRNASAGGSPERQTTFTMHGAEAELKVTISVPYAAAHEYGFSGSVRVPEHQRVITEAFGQKLPAPVAVTVQAHTRSMNVPARPYVKPALEDERESIQQDAIRTLYRLFEGGSA